MRKCGSCGSLLLGDGDNCTRCGAVLPAPPTAKAWPPVAGSQPPPAPSPPAPRAWAPPPTSAPAESAAPAWRESWQPVDVAPVRERPSPKIPVAVLAAAVAAAVIAFFVVGNLRSDPLPAGTSTYVAGGGVVYTSSDGGFQVLLPAHPIVEQRAVSVNGQTVAVDAAVLTAPDYVIGAASVVFPSAVDAGRVDQVLQEALTGDVSGVSGKVVYKNLTRHGSLPALEAKVSAPNGFHAHLFVVASGATLVLLVVDAKTGTDRLYKTLVDSLIVH